MKLPAGVIYNSLWCGIFKDTFSKGWPENSKMLQHVPHLIAPRTLPPYSTLCWMLRINLVFQAINSLFVCRIFSEFYLRWKFMTWNLIKFPQKSLWIFYITYCSYPWALFLPKWTPNKVKSSQHIYFCVGYQLELSLSVVNGER